MEKQFYDEYKLLDEGKFPKELMFTVTEEKEEEEEDHMDLEENEQNWFNTQLEWTRKITERKGATHRYFKDARPTSSRENNEKNPPASSRGTNRQRKKLEDAIKFTKLKK